MHNLYSISEITSHILNHCLGKYQFIYISGNGGAGKSTLSQEIINQAHDRGIDVNCIDMDDFMISKALRRSASKTRTDKHGNERHSQYTRAFPESYNLSSLESIIYSIKQGCDCFYKPKRGHNFTRIHHSYPITIIEGVGTVFLEHNPQAYTIFMMCDQEIEIQRRITRNRDGESDLSHDQVRERAVERNEQFEVTILPHKNRCDLELRSHEDHYIEIKQDHKHII